MKRSALLLHLALVAMFASAPNAAFGQTRRSLTDVSAATLWLTSDALTFARDAYELIRPTADDSVIRIAQVDPLSDSALDSRAETDASGCGWSCFPHDYGCFSYDYAYRAPVHGPLALDRNDLADEGFTCGIWRAKSTALVELPSANYPCMDGDAAVDGEADHYELRHHLKNLLRNALTNAHSMGSKVIIDCKAQVVDAGNQVLSAAQQTLQWLEHHSTGIDNSDRLVIRPLVDINPLLDDDGNLLRFVASSNSELDQEWQVAMDYFAEYGCPAGVWDDQVPPQVTWTENRTANLLSYWVARLSARSAVYVLARSSWVNTAGDAIAVVRTKHEEMLATAEAVVPEIPEQEYMLDESRYVMIDDGQPYWSYDREEYQVNSGASIHSLSQAVLNAARQTWTVHSMAAGESHTKR
jgi:hypothetical protein